MRARVLFQSEEAEEVYGAWKVVTMQVTDVGGRKRLSCERERC